MMLILLLLLVFISPLSSNISIDNTLEIIVEDLDQSIRSSQKTHIGITQFSDNTGNLGGEIGVFGQYLGDELCYRLNEISNGEYQVLDRRNIEALLQEQMLQASDMVNQSTTVDCGNFSGAQLLITGTITTLSYEVSITANLIDVSTSQVAGSRRVRMPLDMDIRALLGDSPSIVDYPADNREEVHNFSVEMISNGEILPMYYHDGDLIVEAQPGQNYQIRLTNNSDKTAACALLIDGISTIALSGNETEVEEIDIKRATLPSDSPKWVLSPDQSITIFGWQRGTGIADQFVFTDVQDSLAATGDYGLQDVGLISANFYLEAPAGSRGKSETGRAGTGAGEEIRSEVRRVNLRIVPDPCAVFTLRYDFRDSLATRGIVE